MNKKTIAIASTLLSGIIFTNLNAQNTTQTLEHKAPNKKEYKNSFGYDVDLIVNGFHGGFVYRRVMPKLTLKIGLNTALNYSGDNSFGYDFEFSEDVTILTIPDSSNVFIGEQSSYDFRSLILNIGIERDFLKKEKGCFFYGGDLVLGIQSYSNTKDENAFKIEKDTSWSEAVIFRNQYTYNKKF
jgi:hypothetical protein